jgi:hypothetical protein
MCIDIQYRTTALALWATAQGHPSAEGLQRVKLIYSEKLLHLYLHNKSISMLFKRGSIDILYNILDIFVCPIFNSLALAILIMITRSHTR